MDTDALALRIRHGEDSRLELKRVQFSGTRIAAPKRSDLADEMAAMANTSGGTVVLGVDDKTRSLLGIPPGKFDIVEEWIVGICEDSIEPPLDMETHKVELREDGGGAALLVVVEIERSLFVHRGPEDISDGRAAQNDSCGRRLWPGCFRNGVKRVPFASTRRRYRKPQWATLTQRLPAGTSEAVPSCRRWP